MEWNFPFRLLGKLIALSDDEPVKILSDSTELELEGSGEFG